MWYITNALTMAKWKLVHLGGKYTDVYDTTFKYFYIYENLYSK